LVFTGTYEHTIDAKNRLAIPAEVRALLRRQPQAGGEPLALYVTRGEGQTLCLYTEAGFEQRAAELDKSELETEQLLAYERVMFSLTRRVELDEQGRVRLPDQLLKMVALPQDVVLLGVKDHLEIRGRDAWYQDMNQTLAQQPQLLMNFRRAMRAPAGGGAGPAGGAGGDGGAMKG
jgi:MraZ protein